MKKITHYFITTLFSYTLLFSTSTVAENHPIHSNNSNITTIQKSIEHLTLREDLPSYVFEYDLERLYPATYEFYKKLDIINRDNIYAYYLYHPDIKQIRHKIIQLVIGKNKGKTPPVPFSLSQALATLQDKETTKETNTNNHTTLKPWLFN